MTRRPSDSTRPTTPSLEVMIITNQEGAVQMTEHEVTELTERERNLMAFQTACWFDTTDETAGRTSLCPNPAEDGIDLYGDTDAECACGNIAVAAIDEGPDHTDYFCEDHVPPTDEFDVRALNVVSTPPLCNEHLAFVRGYIAGQWDGRGRPDDLDEAGIVRFMFNMTGCSICENEDAKEAGRPFNPDESEHPKRLIVRTFVTTGHDPYQAYVLACGHTVI